MIAKLTGVFILASILGGCQHVTINYKSNVNSTDSQVNQSTEVTPEIPIQ